MYSYCLEEYLNLYYYGCLLLCFVCCLLYEFLYPSNAQHIRFRCARDYYVDIIDFIAPFYDALRTFYFPVSSRALISMKFDL